MNKKILYIFIIVVLIITGVFIATKISDKTQTEQTSANDLGENENNLNEENNINQNNESLVESGDNNTENNTGTQENNQDNLEEKAKQIVKENWGEDETVYFSYDGKDETGRYIICVREKETTKALYRYYVDIDTGTFDIE